MPFQPFPTLLYSKTTIKVPVFPNTTDVRQLIRVQAKVICNLIIQYS